ncbi:MAG: cytochrome P450 [Acidimicrobiia bacterium]
MTDQNARPVVFDPNSIEFFEDPFPTYAHLQGRFTTKDVTLHGVTIPKDQPVFLITGSANRDPRVHTDPDRFGITRTNTVAPLGFGRGVHYCIGAALTRTESRIAIEEFLTRWPSFEVDEDGLQRVHMANVAGFSNVPVCVTNSVV